MLAYIMGFDDIAQPARRRGFIISICLYCITSCLGSSFYRSPFVVHIAQRFDYFNSLLDFMLILVYYIIVVCNILIMEENYDKLRGYNLL